MNLVGILFVAAAGLAVLYLFLIMPRIIGRPNTGELQDCLYTHRGFFDNSGEAPENSMAAFREAVERGYGIEFDVQISSDGIPVVFHDDSLERVCGVDGNLVDYSFAELKELRLFQTSETIPSLQEFLNMVNGTVPLIVELKVNRNTDKLCRAADSLLREYHGVYCIESFHPAAVRWYRKHRPGVIRGQLSARFNKNKIPADRNLTNSALSLLLANRISRPDFIAYDCRYPKSLSLLLCRILYRCLTVAWTVKSQDELDSLEKTFHLFIFEGFTPRS